MASRRLSVEIVGDARQLSRTLGDVERRGGRFGTNIGRLGGIVGGMFGGAALVASAKTFMDAARDSERVAARTAAVIASTKGATGLSAKGFSDLAASVSNYAAVDDDVIQDGENMLATFDRIKAGGPNQTFEKATKAAVDLAAGMNHGEVSAAGLQSANVLLGKSLQDPIKGLSSLSRIGVSFTDQQKEQIKTMVEAGDVAGAQGVILAAVNSQFAGSAGSAVTGGKKLAVVWGNMQETLGKLLIPAVERGAEILQDLLGWVEKNKGAAIAIGTALAAVATTMLAVSAATKVATAAQAVAKGATVAWTAAQWLLNVAMTANPIGIVVAIVAALVVGIVIAYKKSETFRKIVSAAWSGIKTAASTAWDFLKDVFHKLQEAAATAGRLLKIAFLSMLDVWLTVVGGIVGAAATAFGWVPGIGGKLKQAAGKFREFKDSVNKELNKLKDHDLQVAVIARLKSPEVLKSDAAKARHLIGLAEGGRVFGPGTRTSDSVPARLSAGEHVWSASEVDGAGGHGSMERMRGMARTGQLPSFAAGGHLGVRVGVNDRTDWSGFRAGLRRPGQVAAQIATDAAKVLARGAAAKIARDFAASLGGGLAGIKKWIRSTDALPYRWGAAGPGSFDCSGITSAVFGKMTKRGGGQGQRYFTTASNFGALGFKPGIGGTYSIGVTPGRHMAGVYGGLRFEARSTKSGIFVGPSARSVASFPRRFHLAKGGHIDLGAAEIARLGRLGGVDIGGDTAGMRVAIGKRLLDRGGWIYPGVNVVENRTGKPERVSPPGGDGLDYDRLARAIVGAFAAAPMQVNLDGRRVAESTTYWQNKAAR